MSSHASPAPSTPPPPPRFAPPLLAAAAIVIGHALLAYNYYHDHDGLHWLIAGFALAWLGVLIPFSSRRLTWAVCVGGLIWQCRQLMGDEPLGDARVPARFFGLFVPLLCLAAAATVVPGRWRTRVFIPALLVAHFLVGTWLLRWSPSPFIDVYKVTHDSCVAFSSGVDPYTITIPNIYADRPDWSARFYSPDILKDGRVQLGYPYMPLSFAVAYAGDSLGGDFRLGQLAAVTAAAGFMAYAGSGSLAALAGAILLLTPRGYYVIEQGWSEPTAVVCLAFVTFCAVRKPRWLPWAVGLLMVSKQHMIVGAPALLLLMPRPWKWKTLGVFAGKAFLIGAVVTLPMVLWNVHAFWHSAIEVQLNNPFRNDSWNFVGPWVQAGHAIPPGWLSFAAAALAAAIAVWRLPRTPAGYATAVAVIYLTFFALAKQAFCNYYFFTIAALCCAVAASSRDDRNAQSI
jgi:hypothetical protein